MGTFYLEHRVRKKLLMKFGYARVSKSDQSLKLQIQKLKDAGCDEIFAEKVSGAKDDRTELNHLMRINYEKVMSFV